MESVRGTFEEGNLSHFRIYFVPHKCNLPVTIMASVRDEAAPLPPTESNVVLYQMMMHYKRRMEVAEEREDHYKKRMKVEEELYQEEIDVWRQSNRRFSDQLYRTQLQLINKHDAGMKLAACLDNMFEAVDLAYDTDLGGKNNLAVAYLDTIKDQEQGRAATAFELLISEHHENAVDVALIDLVTTEEEDNEEED